VAIENTNISIKDVVNEIETVNSNFPVNIPLSAAANGDPWAETSSNIGVGAFRGSESISNKDIDWVDTSGVAAVTGIQDSDRGLINAWSLVNANGSLDASKSRNVSSVTNVTSGHFRWNWLQPIPERIGNNYPVMFRGTDDRESGFLGGDRTLHFYVYNFMNLHSRFSCEARFRYNRDGVGRDWAINHASMMMHLPWDGDRDYYRYLEFEVEVGSGGPQDDFKKGFSDISPTFGEIDRIEDPFSGGDPVDACYQDGDFGSSSSTGNVYVTLREDAEIGSRASIHLKEDGAAPFAFGTVTVSNSRNLTFNLDNSRSGGNFTRDIIWDRLGDFIIVKLLYKVA